MSPDQIQIVEAFQLLARSYRAHSYLDGTNPKAGCDKHCEACRIEAWMNANSATYRLYQIAGPEPDPVGLRFMGDSELVRKSLPVPRPAHKWPDKLEFIAPSEGEYFGWLIYRHPFTCHWTTFRRTTGSYLEGILALVKK